MLGWILFLGCNFDVAGPPAVEPKYGSLELNLTFDRPRAQVALQVGVAEGMYAEEEFWDKIPNGTELEILQADLNNPWKSN